MIGDSVLKVLIVIGALAVAFGFKVIFKAPDDNPVEQIAEFAIKQETGLDIDLSPEVEISGQGGVPHDPGCPINKGKPNCTCFE